MSKRVSNWYSFEVCEKCHKRIMDNERMYNDGLCPHCGNESGDTICDTKKVVLRRIRHYSWWNFWDKKVTYEAKKGFSTEWNNKIDKQ